jgi:hypothetical protein
MARSSINECRTGTEAIKNVLRDLHPEMTFGVNPNDTAIAVKIEGEWIPQLALMLTNTWGRCPNVLANGKPVYTDWVEVAA